MKKRCLAAVIILVTVLIGLPGCGISISVISKAEALNSTLSR